jgi:hypothetical protein
MTGSQPEWRCSRPFLGSVLTQAIIDTGLRFRNNAAEDEADAKERLFVVDYW